MDLRTESPFWLMRHGIINSYPSLQKDIRTDIAIMGAGISGALAAWELARAGYRVTIIDRRHAGTGSTAASTALLQYEIDTPLLDLIRKVGERNAKRSYELCRDSIYDLQKICTHLKEEGLFRLRPSLQYASFAKHVNKLEKEFTLRREMGFNISWLDEKAIYSQFGFRKAAAVLSEDGAEADAYRITHLLLASCIRKGATVYDNTEIKNIRHEKNGVELRAETGFRIRAKKLIIACGYESQRYLTKKVQQLQTTFAIVSEPQVSTRFWHQNALIWETARPYLYMRTTDDHRILLGGKDIDSTSPGIRDEWLHQKAKALEKSFARLFPDIPFRTDFKWGGLFASTKDGLPFIGSVPERPHTYFALGFGGNGITFSIIAAKMIRKALEGKRDADMEIFSFNR